jgi:hypothetical protein
MDNRLVNWLAPNKDLLPDFIIGGAMKSGTTTLREILNKHPDVFLPSKEIHFFDIDNIIQHGEFNCFDKHKGNWISQSMDANPEKLWNWYLSHFQGKDPYLKGEDSTTYLASNVAAQRIAMQRKSIKLIFLLRQPTKRAYSNYLHELKAGRMTHTFENILRYNPFMVLNRSLYKNQLDYYYQLLPKERIKIVLFEDLVGNTKDTIQEISDFLKINFQTFPSEAFQIHANKSTSHANIHLQLIKNRVLGNYGTARYTTTLPNELVVPSKLSIVLSKAVEKAHSILNPHQSKSRHHINPKTYEFLNNYFRKELDGLNELVGMDILSRWFPAVGEPNQ